MFLESINKANWIWKLCKSRESLVERRRRRRRRRSDTSSKVNSLSNCWSLESRIRGGQTFNDESAGASLTFVEQPANIFARSGRTSHLGQLDRSISERYLLIRPARRCVFWETLGANKRPAEAAPDRHEYINAQQSLLRTVPCFYCCSRRTFIFRPK